MGFAGLGLNRFVIFWSVYDGIYLCPLLSLSLSLFLKSAPNTTHGLHILVRRKDIATKWSRRQKNKTYKLWLLVRKQQTHIPTEYMRLRRTLDRHTHVGAENNLVQIRLNARKTPIPFFDFKWRTNANKSRAKLINHSMRVDFLITQKLCENVAKRVNATIRVTCRRSSSACICVCFVRVCVCVCVFLVENELN